MPIETSSSGSVPDGLYFRQLLSGRDYAVNDQIAIQMRNFSYLIGDMGSRKCVVVDPAYAPGELHDVVLKDGYELVGALVTHYHADHCGGNMMGFNLPGVVELLDIVDVPIYAHQNEISWIRKTTGIGEGHLRETEEGSVLSIGSIDISFLHTPGHTPGSQCFMVRDRLISGDTVFLDGCGRTDLPGGDPEQMYRSLRRLAMLPPKTDLYPGHHYSQEPFSTMNEVTANNVVFRASTESDWLRLFG
jgi:glyoxylase-like metal-dependent hydrolase (beta-lactamase superfamily II)